MRPEAHPDWLRPEGLPPGVGALMSTRAGGVSQGPFAGLNLRPASLPGDALDRAEHIAENQRRWAAAMAPARPVWLDQVHGTEVVRLDRGHRVSPPDRLPVADASVTTVPGLACTVLVADCLPALFASADGRVVAAAHAGWRGLAAGVLERTLEAMGDAGVGRPAEVSVWLGACIGPQAFEVGDEVRAAFLAQDPPAAACFRPGAVPGKWWADLPGLARQRLARAGVGAVSGGRWCTHSDASRFFSFRRDRVTGRLAASVWIEG